MAQEAFNTPHMSGKTGGDVGSDTHVRVAKIEVAKRAHRREAAQCSRCAIVGGKPVHLCNRCQVMRPLTDFYFTARNGKDSHEAICVKCKADINRAYLKRNAKDTKRIVATAKKTRRAKTIVKEVKAARRLTTTKGDTGLTAMLDVGMFLAKSDKRAWKKKLNEEIAQAHEHVAKCRVALALLGKI